MILSALPSRTPPQLAFRNRRNAGLSLAECLLAMWILSMAVLSMTYTMAAGHGQLVHSDTMLRGVRLAEDVMEEIIAKPYAGTGVSRASYCLNDYDGFELPPGNVADLTGALYPDSYQGLTLQVQVAATTVTVPELDNAALPGRFVSITVFDAEGETWTLTRFIPEPASP